MLDRTALSSAMYFSVSFDGSIVTISMDRSTHFRLDVSTNFLISQEVDSYSFGLYILVAMYRLVSMWCYVTNDRKFTPWLGATVIENLSDRPAVWSYCFGVLFQDCVQLADFYVGYAVNGIHNTQVVQKATTPTNSRLPWPHSCNYATSQAGCYGTHVNENVVCITTCM